MDSWRERHSKQVYKLKYSMPELKTLCELPQGCVYRVVGIYSDVMGLI